MEGNERKLIEMKDNRRKWKEIKGNGRKWTAGFKSLFWQYAYYVNTM